MRRYIVAFCVLCTATASASAQDAAIIKVKQTAVIDRLGDGKMELEIKLPAVLYNEVKKTTPNTAVILRSFGIASGEWLEVEDVKGEYRDAASTIRMECTTRGLARMGRHGQWETPLLNSDSLEAVSVAGNVAVFTSAAQTPIGLATSTVKVTVPQGCSDLKMLESPARLAYRLRSVAAPAGSCTAVDLNFQSKPQVMTCLAKCYANPSFMKMWAARTVLKNTGDQPIYDYRIRFRVVDYTTTWSSWQQCAEVLPGQTVVDPFYPIFDLTKIAALNSMTRASLEVEYEYRRDDGRVVRESDSRTIQLMGRNEVYYSSMSLKERLDFKDAFDYAPAILAAFTTRDDPIIQQVAGWVSGQNGLNAASLSDADALKFIEALYAFMAGNEIAYQTPPTGSVNDQLSQHLKYGREVLQNRAGTCIDLSIFIASVCEAVGLEPVLFVIPGHCFVGIQLPQSKQLKAVEATMVGRHTFQEALKVGNDQAEKARKDGNVWEVNIPAMRKMGVHGLDLPALPTTTLNDWGIKRIKAAATPAPQKTSTPASATSTNVVGTWTYADTWDGDKVSYSIMLDKAGNFTESIAVDGPSLKRETKNSGKYELVGKALMLQYTTGERKDQKLTRPCVAKDGAFWITVKEFGYQIALTRKKS